MAAETIGLLHPGEMGAGVGAALVEAGYTVTWASAGRSPASARRAAAGEPGRPGHGRSHGRPLPAHHLHLSAQQRPRRGGGQRGAGFDGLYLDANAIAPATARRVAEVIEARGGRYVDGGIIGNPPTTDVRSPASTYRVPQQKRRAVCSRGRRSMPGCCPRTRPAASAVKMCFAAWTKGTTALLLAIRALAIAEGVEEPLLDAWSSSMPELESAQSHCSPAGRHQRVALGGRDGGDCSYLSIRRAARRFPPGCCRHLPPAGSRRAGRRRPGHAQIGPGGTHASRVSTPLSSRPGWWVPGVLSPSCGDSTPQW